MKITSSVLGAILAGIVASYVFAGALGGTRKGETLRTTNAPTSPISLVLNPMKDGKISEIIGIEISGHPLVSITMPCGKIYELYPGQLVPDKDVPCSCGDTNHWVWKFGTRNGEFVPAGGPEGTALKSRELPPNDSATLWQTVLPVKITSQTATNVIVGDNSSGCHMCYDENGHRLNPMIIPAIMGPPCQPYHAPTERWEITNVVKTTTIIVTWNQKQFTITDEELLSGVTNRQTLVREWKASESFQIAPRLSREWKASEDFRITPWSSTNSIITLTNSSITYWMTPNFDHRPTE